MGKTRDLFKKTGDIKETFHAKMGTVKDRKGKDLTEAKEIKKSWQEYTKELYKKGLNDQITTVTYLEPDTLEYEVKWALRSINTSKASGGDGIPAEVFQTLKDSAVKVLHSICQEIWKTRQCPIGLEMNNFYSNSKEEQCQRMFKLPYSCPNFTCH